MIFGTVGSVSHMFLHYTNSIFYCIMKCGSGNVDVAARFLYMMMSSNGNIFRVTGPLCGEFTGPGEFPTQRLVTRSFDVFFDLRLNKRLSKQPWGWWFETPSWPLWRQCNGYLAQLPVGLTYRMKCTYSEQKNTMTHRWMSTMVSNISWLPVIS